MIKEKVKGIIEKLTTETNSILSEKIYDLAAELGIGDLHVKDSIHELMEENYIDQPVLGVIKKL
tara:strand:+ start:671 stop:862 length:192 start_codon:yes stop_codon:yes gene_type:complete